MQFEWEAAEIFPSCTTTHNSPRASYVLTPTFATVLLDTFTDRRLLEHLTWDLNSRGLRATHNLECPGSDQHIRGSALMDKSSGWATHNGRVLEGYIKLDLWQHENVTEQAARMKLMAPMVSNDGSLSPWGKSLPQSSRKSWDLREGGVRAYVDI
eukprot:FR741827.1.p1 GENE.FR741827.1~~FR741827.1.p1  ORF type:complete len:155 (-),score=0.62 FR741827.1:20-484(-)